MRAYTHRLITFAIQCAMIAALTFGLSFSAGQSLAQDVTPETPVPTETGTVAPTDAPTEIPTVVPTDVPTEVVTEAPTGDVTSEPTPAPTDDPATPIVITDTALTPLPTDSTTLPPVTPVNPDLFTEDFQDGESTGWVLTSGWALVDDAGNTVLGTVTGSETAMLTAVSWPYYTLSFRVLGSVQLSLTSGGSSYQVKIATDGAVALYKDGVLLAESAGVPVVEGSAQPTPEWHTVNILAPGNLLAVKVDDLTPISTSDPLLLGMGPLVFSTDSTNTAPVAIDDISIRRLDAPPPAPTPEPTSAIGTLPPPPELTAEPTVEVTAEATAEATVEATSEATAEATVEATAEATVEPSGLTEDVRAKLPSAMQDIFDLYMAGDMAAVEAALQNYYIQIDDQQRISVTIWAANEASAATIAGSIPAAGGLLTDAFSIQLQAFVTLDGLMALVNSPDVNLIELPPRAVSTSSSGRSMEVQNTGQGAGNEVTEGLDSTGATAWHTANIKGSGVGIAVIDTGFGYNPAAPTTTTVGAAGEYSCLFNNTINGAVAPASGDTTHGLNMVQVLCDMAPASKVYMYKATSVATLRTAILNARSNAAIKVIFIAMDVGASAGPGDGTGGGLGSVEDDLYAQITAARTAGKIVIASAGNNTERYVTLNYTSGNVTIPMTVNPGDTIHISWNDWTVSGTKAYASSLSGAFSQTISGATSRSAGTVPRSTYTVNSGQCASDCSETLTISGITPGIIQIQVAGTGTITSSGIAPFSALVETAGNIARPADSQDVIAVGAVCPDDGVQLFLEQYSSHGPLYAAGGGLPIALTSYTRDQVKPDLVGPTHVSINGNPASQIGCNEATGLNGTSASAAHVAGMAALIVSNTAMGVSTPDAVQNYLQTHTLDNTTIPGYAVGYDNFYGAGYTMLGNPSYNMGLVVAVNVPVNQLPPACTTPLYVGLNNAGSSQDGTLTNPYISIAEAMSKATATECVVVLPGEYVAQIYANSSTLTPAVLSYESATSFQAPSSTNLWSVITSPIFASSNTGIIIDGFVAQRAAIMTDTNVNSPNFGLSIRTETPALRIRTSTNLVVQNSTFLLYKSPGTLTDNTGIQLKNNLFSGFTIPSTGTGNFVAPQKNSAILEVTRSNGTILSNNTFQNSTIPQRGSFIPNPWLPAIIGISNSGVKLYNNQFKNNTASTVVAVNQLAAGSGSARNTQEVQFVSNLFSVNTTKGPLLHLFSLPRFRFVNNTVVNNVIQGETAIIPDNTRYDGYFVFGATNSSYDDLAGDGRQIEIHNNLFYGNGRLERGLIFDAPVGLNIGCNAIGSGTPVRNNWFVPYIGTNPAIETLAGECNAQISGSINEPITLATTFFGTGFDAVHPFRLRPTDSSIVNLKSGINTGDDQALIDIFGTDVLTGYMAQMDLRGSMRVNAGTNPNPTYQATHVDIGAYELGTASAPVADPILRTVIEDSSPSIVFTLTATGGYTQTFALSTMPTEYDRSPTNACLGQPVRFTSPNIVTYCPPANFHTQYGAGNTNVPVVIGFTVEDRIFKPGEFSNSTISLTITPQDDGSPTAVDFNALSDYFTSISQQLSPIAQFGNFSLSGTGSNVDYPFTFAFGAQTPVSGDNDDLLKNGPSGDSTAQVLTDAFTAANSNGGKLILNPVAGQQGFYKFTFTVTDQDGDSATGNGTVVILPTLAQEGTYDDASFNFLYNGSGWSPAFVTGAYNNTLHRTSVGGVTGPAPDNLPLDSVELPFTGKVARLYLRASTNAASTVKLTFKVDLASGTNTFANYTETKTAVPALTCVSSLDGAAPNAVTSNLNNFSSTGGVYTITCSGFPSGQVHSIRLTNNVNGTALTVDRADISAGVMTAGKSYQESSPNITYTGAWNQVANVSTLGGAWAHTNQNGATFSFKIDNSVGRIVFYRTIYAAGVYGTMNVYLDGNLTTPIATIPNNTSPTFKFAQPFLLTIASPGDHTITVRNIGATYSNIDQISTLPIAPSMGLGTYQETYPDLTYSGNWVKASNANVLGGTWTYTAEADANVTFKVDSSVSRIVIYRTIYQAGVYGTMNVYLDNETTPIATIANNTSTTFAYAQPYLITIPSPGTHTIRIQNVGATYSGIDQISLLGPIQTLTTTPGVYQENDLNLSYTGKWTQAANANMLLGGWAHTNVNGASVSFKVNSSVSRIVIYRTIYQPGVYGTMNVYVNDELTTTIANNTSATFQYGQPFVLDVTPGDNTIRLQNVGTTYSGIDQIRLMGSLNRLGAGNTYQDSDLNLTYTGNWSPSWNPAFIAGTRRITSQQNATLTFKINSTVERIIFYRTTAPGWGSMSVTISGNTITPTPIMLNTTPAALFGQPYMVTIPSPGDLDVTVTNLSALNSDIDQIVLLGASDRLTVNAGTIQETDPALSYKGNWNTQANTSTLGGTRRYTNQNDAEVSFKIDSSVKRIMVFRTIYQAGVYGSMQVLLDNGTTVTPLTTIPNTPSATLAFGQPFLITIPTPGNLTVILKNVGSTYSDIDQITLLPVETRLTAGTTGKSYQENHQDIRYTGAWTYNTNPSMAGNSWRNTNQNNAQYEFDIDASVGRIIFYRSIFAAGVYGTMSVLVDDVPVATMLNNTSAVRLDKQPFVLEIGAPGNHKITVKNVGTTYGSIDQIDLLPEALPLTTVMETVQENDINLTYRGIWTQASNAQTINGAWRYTNDPTGGVTFKVDSSVSRVVVYRTIYATGVYGTMQVFVDNSPTALTTIPNNTSASFLYGQPFAFDVAGTGTRTITIKNVGATYSGIDQIQLLGTAPALGLGDYQELDERLKFTNNWVQAANASAFASAWRYTNTPDASLSFDINNTVGRIVIYRTTNLAGVYGSMQVFLSTDMNTPIATISNVSASALFKQPVVVPINNPGDHTVIIKNVGATYSSIDQLTLLGPAATLGVGNYQEHSFDLSYSGAWTQIANANMIESAWAYTNTAGSSVSFKVDASTVKRMIVYRTTNIAGVYGTTQVLLNGAVVATMNNVSTTALFRQPFFVTIPDTTTTVELRNVGTTYSSVDQISLLGDPATLSAFNTYEETNPAFTFSGPWTAVTGTEPSGNGAFYTYTQGATVEFNVFGTAFSIYSVVTPSSGSFRVDVFDGVTQVFTQTYSNTAASALWQQPYEISGLANTTHRVVITKTSSAATFIYFDAVRIVDASAALTVGQYQETYPGLLFTNTWTPNTPTSTTRSTSSDGILTFSFTGTGFGIITGTQVGGGTMRITYTGCTTCNVDLTPTQANLGYSYYNLKQGTYTVTVTRVSGGAISIDRVFVLGTPSATLQPGTYEENAAGIVYSPRDLWTLGSSPSYSGGTFRRTTQIGAVVQLRFNGNSLFLYQAAHPNGSSRLNLCVYLTDAAGNPTSLCTTYSQNETTATTFVAPVAFYGFGSGVHEVVIENRSSMPFNVDRILVN